MHRRQRRIVIARSGKPIAALIDVRLFERLRKLDEEFEQLGQPGEGFCRRERRKRAALVDEAVEPRAASRRALRITPAKTVGL